MTAWHPWDTTPVSIDGSTGRESAREWMRGEKFCPWWHDLCGQPRKRRRLRRRVLCIPDTSASGRGVGVAVGRTGFSRCGAGSEPLTFGYEDDETVGLQTRLPSA